MKTVLIQILGMNLSSNLDVKEIRVRGAFKRKDKGVMLLHLLY